MARVVISLVTWNSIQHIPACLTSLLEQTFEDFQLLIVDNASTDGTEVLISNSKPIHNSLFIIRNAENKGYAGAHNQSIRWAKENGAEFVLALNPDVLLAPNAIEAMVQAMERHPTAGSVGIPLLHTDGTIDSLGLNTAWGGRWIEHEGGEGYRALTSDEQVLGLSGACVFYRLAALESVAYHTKKENEYLDERFFAYKEDIDMALRLKKNHWEAWITYTAKALHGRVLADASGGKVVTQYRGRARRSPHRSYLSYRNHLFILKKHWRVIPTAHWQIVFYEIGKAVYILFREPWLLKAWGEVWKLNT